MMKRWASVALWLLTAVAAAGCSTTQEVTVTKPSSTKVVTSVAYVKEPGPGADMHQNMQAALERLPGITSKAPLPAGTRTASDVDALVTFVDRWQWDITMYLQRLEVRVYDSASGDLLVTGFWQDAFMHGWKDAKVVMTGLVDEIFSKLPGRATPPQALAPTPTPTPTPAPK